MTTDNGVVRYDVYPGTQEYEVTYYLFIRRFEGFENQINYHIRLNSASEENQYEFRMAQKTGHRKNLLQGMKTEFTIFRFPEVCLTAHSVRLKCL